MHDAEAKDHLAASRSEGHRVVAAVRGAALDARVPGLDWDVRTVATHTGAVHRWAADVVRRRLPTNETGGSVAFWPAGLGDADLPAWLAEGTAALVSTLDEAPEDLRCFTFVGGIDPLTFWYRRQAHETAVHRADVQAAGPGVVTPLSAALAQDGLAELVGAFATEPGFAASGPGVLLLLPHDGPAWRVDLGCPNRVTTGPDLDLAPADVVVRGSSSDVYLWAWNRPAAVEVTGDAAVVALWRDVRVART